MRIEFVSSARGDFHWSRPVLTIGRADDNDLVVSEAQVAARHVTLHRDRRGLVLEVAPDTGRVYVNARPVRERALLRPGDSLSLGDCRMLIRDDADLEAREVREPTQSRCTVALRPVAGPLSGRVIPVGDRLELGASHGAMPLELPGNDAALLVLAWEGGELVLDASRVPARHAVRVNGVKVVRASLQPGDQIGVASHRFVLDGPGWAAEPKVVMPEPEPEPLPEDAAGPRGDVWWLILTAAVLALGIALVLFVQF
ncbi:pSer/pThr/pTyr-binding forkhead associated (FHA) protein [Luteibacter jiangsuensis]|uniref:PSer/pThr/pTyr-binding forkhead associated (FHA) protein n=1 Tax=Luteibacter jiangsuensis TaxID=637577 RepID=A0ABT9T049_9GAMM|nr:FHA domain-containing protein [Luteibacter jiangsuensis]MDQ0010375.1 pSer/pThr/pTyr-binding forkhead associated (FHA) protein [Luteibacter jiangsuensis]